MLNLTSGRNLFAEDNGWRPSWSPHPLRKNRGRFTHVAKPTKTTTSIYLTILNRWVKHIVLGWKGSEIPDTNDQQIENILQHTCKPTCTPTKCVGKFYKWRKGHDAPMHVSFPSTPCTCDTYNDVFSSMRTEFSTPMIKRQSIDLSYSTDRSVGTVTSIFLVMWHSQSFKLLSLK